MKAECGARCQEIGCGSVDKVCSPQRCIVYVCTRIIQCRFTVQFLLDLRTDSVESATKLQDKKQNTYNILTNTALRVIFSPFVTVYVPLSICLLSVSA